MDCARRGALPRGGGIGASIKFLAGGQGLADHLELGSAAYRKLVKGSALRRASRVQLARNAAVALGNSGDPRAIAPLQRAARKHTSALVRGHAAWALGRLGGDAARATLAEVAEHDLDASVRSEAVLALGAA